MCYFTQEEEYGDDFECEDSESINESDGKLLDFAQPNCHAREFTKEGEDEGESFFQDSMEMSSLRVGGEQPAITSPPSRETVPASRTNGRIEAPHHNTNNDSEFSPFNCKNMGSTPGKKVLTSATIQEEVDEDISKLASRLQALDPTKQGQLMALLQQMEGVCVQVGTAAGASARGVESERNGDQSLHTHNHLQTPHNLASQNTITPREAHHEDDPQRVPSKLHTSFGSSQKVKLRIKAYNSWGKTKYASLSAIRLCVRGSNVEIPLSEFSSRVILLEVFVSNHAKYWC
mgnify:FL=1